MVSISINKCYVLSYSAFNLYFMFPSLNNFILNFLSYNVNHHENGTFAELVHFLCRIVIKSVILIHIVEHDFFFIHTFLTWG